MLIAVLHSVQINSVQMNKPPLDSVYLTDMMSTVVSYVATWTVATILLCAVNSAHAAAQVATSAMEDGAAGDKVLR